jgi:predicted HTH domain antitoxin
MASADAYESLEDLILALAYAPGPGGKIGEPLKGRTVLQKLLFHLKKSGVRELPSDQKPHFYGPFDEMASSAYDGLQNSGYLAASPIDSSIKLTPSGLQEAEPVWEKKLSGSERDLISDLKRRFGDLSTDEMLAVTYAKYPDTAVESLVRKDLEKKGPGIAINLVRRGKVSVELGAKIADMPLKDFMHLLSRNKIPVVERSVT